MQNLHAQLLPGVETSNQSLPIMCNALRATDQHRRTLNPDVFANYYCAQPIVNTKAACSTEPLVP